jgi:hypothetical protein
MTNRVEACRACGQGIDRTKRSPVWAALPITAFGTSPLWFLTWVFRGDARTFMALITGAACRHCFTLWRGNYKVRPK